MWRAKLKCCRYNEMTMEEDRPVCEVVTERKCDQTSTESKWLGRTQCHEYTRVIIYLLPLTYSNVLWPRLTPSAGCWSLLKIHGRFLITYSPISIFQFIIYIAWHEAKVKSFCSIQDPCLKAWYQTCWAVRRSAWTGRLKRFKINIFVFH